MATLSFINYLRGIYDLNLNDTSEAHRAVIQSIYDSFVTAEGDIDQMRLELSIKTATGYWLDCWGDYFGVPRKSNEGDPEYSERIIDSVISPKSTIPAIKDYIVNYLNAKYNKDYTRDDVVITEPWKLLSKYSHKGDLSSTSRFYSKDYYCHAVIDISIPEAITDDLRDLVKSVKSAGVKAIWSAKTDWDIVKIPEGERDAYADYTRHIQTQLSTHLYSGLVLSNTSAHRYLSGRRTMWRQLESIYEFKAVVKDRDADTSRILSKFDLFNILDKYYTDHVGVDTDISDNTVIIDGVDNFPLMNAREQWVRRDYLRDALKLNIKDYTYNTLSNLGKVSGDVAETYTYRIEHQITDELLDSLSILNQFITLNKGILNTNTATLPTTVPEHQIYKDLCANLLEFKAKNEDYYNSVQAPIYVTDKVYTPWYVRNDHFIWNSITLSYKDLYELWDGDRKPEYSDSKTLETLYRRENFEIGDTYQPKLMVGEKQYAVAKPIKEWLFNSDTLCIEDLDAVYSVQFRYVDGLSTTDKQDCTLDEIMLLEEHYTNEGYSSVANDLQSIISVEEATL